MRLTVDYAQSPSVVIESDQSDVLDLTGRGFDSKSA